MAIKVLVISNYKGYHESRPEASIFLGLAKLGFEIHIMTYGDCQLADEFREVGINVIDFHPEKKFDRKEITKIRDFVTEEKIDILHLFNSISTVNGIIAAKKLPVKVVLYRGYGGNIKWYDPTSYLKYLNPRVDKIVCNAKGIEEYIQGQLFFDKSKTITINKGHNVEWYSSYKPIEIRKELGIPADSFLFVNVANNRKMKGIPYLLEAFNSIPEDLPVHLLLVGKNMDTKENLEILKANENKSKVHFLGFRRDAINITASCDAFVLSSIMGESITKAVVEAMALAVPPIITDIPGNRELAIHNESGLVVPAKNHEHLKDAMVQMYRDVDLRKRLGDGAKKRIENELSYKTTISKMKALYEDLYEN